MALDWEQVAIQAVDPVELGRWWADGLGWVVVDDGPDVVEIRPAPDRTPGIMFLPAPRPKASQNRLHLDFRPDDQDAEVARFLARGATRVSVGQGADATWVVLADPEGNEFCVLGPRRTATSR